MPHIFFCCLLLVVAHCHFSQLKSCNNKSPSVEYHFQRDLPLFWCSYRSHCRYLIPPLMSVHVWHEPPPNWVTWVWVCIGERLGLPDMELNSFTLEASFLRDVQVFKSLHHAARMKKNVTRVCIPHTSGLLHKLLCLLSHLLHFSHWFQHCDYK